MSLEAYAQKTLFQPLGMNDTSFHRTDAVKAALAVGYESRKKVAEDLEIILPAAGSVFSTPNDMVKYVESLLCAYNNHKDHPLALSFRHNILDEMWSPQFSQFVPCERCMFPQAH
jgi:CubicO group peptidase (beta-lactamase class C family)